MTSSKRKLKILTIAEKVDVINAVERSGKKNYEVANEFGIPSSTLSTIMKNKTKIMANFGLLQPGREKMKRAEYPDLDAGLFEWFVQQQRLQQCRDGGGGPVGGPALKRKADALAKSLGHSNFKNSTGWLDKWKKRNNVVLRRPRRRTAGAASGEDAPPDDDVAAAGRTAAYRRHCVSTAAGQYSPDDVFAADATAVLYECLPGCAGDRSSRAKGCCGRRVTVLLCANMSGAERARPLVVGERRRPRCLRAVRSAPVDYASSGRGARLTAAVWDRWLAAFDERIAAQGRRVVLFVDDRVAPPPPPRLTAVTVRFLPAAVDNTSSSSPSSSPKPLGPAVIRDFKALYRGQAVRELLASSAPTFSVGLLRAVRMIAKAWRLVTPHTVADCFRAAGFAPGPPGPDRDDDRRRWSRPGPVEWARVAERLRLETDRCTFDGYVGVDDGLPVLGDPAEGGPAGSSSSEEEDDSTSDDGLIDGQCKSSRTITVLEAAKALDVLRGFVETTEGMDQTHFEALATIEDTLDKIKWTETTQQLFIKQELL